MYAGVFVFAVLLAGTQGCAYRDVGECLKVVADETFNYKNIYPLLYVHSVTKLSDSELIDGIVVHITKLEGNEDVMFKTFDVHTKDRSMNTLYYQDINMGSGVALEFIADEESNSTLEFNLIAIGQIPECDVLIFRRCSDLSTHAPDVTQVLKKDKAPLSDACEAKVAEIIKDKGFVVTPSYVLPYALKNYS